MEQIEAVLTSDDSYTKIIADKKPWIDPKFPHDTSVVKGLPGVASWMRASEIFKDKEKVYESFSVEDVIKGQLNDAYLLGAISALSEFPGRVQKLFIQKEKNLAGCYVVRLYICGQYVDVMVDDFFPVNKDGAPAFAGSNGKELWVMLIEKAWAKIHGSFNTIEEGDTRESLSAITGAPVEYYKHKDIKALDLWTMMKSFIAENYVMCTSAALETKGVTNNYAYTLVNTYELNLKNENVKLVQVSNSLAKTEWNGPWSDRDPRWTTEMKSKVDHIFKDDGTFFMSFEDFYEIFAHTFVAKVKDKYVHSSLVVKGQKGFVGFRVRRQLNGFISGYQVTKRLGATVVRNFAVERLKIELYKFNKNKLELVKDVWNNPVGQANMEITLEPGTYVLKGSFDFSTKLPYIVFNAYCERSINLVELKIKNQRHATLEGVTAALSTIKKAYSISTDKKGAVGGFRTCLVGHGLEWSTESFKEEIEFDCENCQKKKLPAEGRWFCKKCNYDVCGECRPRSYGKSEGSTPSCSQSHPLSFVPLEDPKDIYLCDQCGKAYYGSVARWCCKECSLDLCRSCMAAPASYKGKDEVLEINTCPKNHKLDFVVTDTNLGVYECYVCSKVGDVHNGRWACLNCEISICPICKPTAKAKDGVMTVKTMTIVCSNSHILMFGCKPPGSEETLKCFKCKAAIGSDNWRWTCDVCEYDICVDCRKAPEGRRDMLCSSMHMLQYSVLPLGNITVGRCDKCHKVYKLESGRYTCFGCSYDCCNQCVPKVNNEASGDIEVVEKSGGRRRGELPKEVIATAAAGGSENCIII